MENYKQQEKLNDLFNNYSRNYQYCYMGPNTASHQINAPVDDIGMSNKSYSKNYYFPIKNTAMKVKSYHWGLVFSIWFNFI